MEDLKNVFDDIYKNKKWGANGGIYSGEGSHNPIIVMPYLHAVKWFFEKFDRKPNVVDFGCGDFNVGRQIRPFCGRYYAIDISASVIERNILEFKDLDVDFLNIDARNEDIPNGDVVFVRQVFQHLSNDSIIKILPRLSKFRFIVFTDHIPAHMRFQPNIDIETGRLTRLVKGSGVVLTAFPFLLNPVNEFLLCAIPSEGGVIKTIAYQTF